MQDYSRKPTISRGPSRRRKKNRLSDFLLFFFLLLSPTVCAVTFGFALYRAGYVPDLVSSNLTATAVARRNASCQALIEKAMQISNSSCGQIGSNKACYGNDTIVADLAPGTTQKLSERGDIVDVDQIRRISASPLKLDSNEWGIAYLKIIANLPRSLPGQTVTMIVFGNTTLDNSSGSLESFFFSSELGRINCEKIPDDGIMLSVPDGEGIRFTVNGAELTLTGDASITAVKNGQMAVSLFEGSARIVSDGHEQYFGAGQQVNVQLGGANGTESVGPPSPPVQLSQNDLDTACALTGQFCSQGQIIPVTGDLAEHSIQEELGTLPTATPTVTRTPSMTPTATNTLLVIPSWTPSRSPTSTQAATLPVRNTPVRTSRPRPTPVPTDTSPSNPPVPTQLPTLTATLIPPNTATSEPTFTFTPIPTAANSEISGPACTESQVVAGDLRNGENSLLLDLTNNTVETLAIDAMHIVWNTDAATRILDQHLNEDQIGNANEPVSPSDFPVPNPFTGPISRRQIEIVGNNTETLGINFQDPPIGEGYIVQVHFDIGCQIKVSR